MLYAVAEEALFTLGWLPVGQPVGEPAKVCPLDDATEWAEDSDKRSSETILLDGLSHVAPTYRREAIETLERLQATHTTDALRHCLNDTDCTVRLTA